MKPANISPQQNQNQACFICNKIYPRNRDTESELRVFSLRFICQYLKVNCDSPNPDYCKNSEETSSNVTPNFSVLLCDPCSGLNAKLGSLIQQLETTQMLINYEMQKLQKALSTIPSGDPCDITLDTSGTGKNIRETSLRILVTENCSKEVTRIVKSYPSVLVERVAIEGPIQLQSDTSDCESDYSDELYEPVEPEQDYSENEITDDEDFRSNFPDIAEDDPRTRLVHIASYFYNHIAGAKETDEECKSCRILYKYRRRGHFTDHLAACHPEHVFEHQRLPHVTQQQFEACCKHALNLQINQAKRLKEEKDFLMCPHCKFKCNSNNKLRSHLVIDHAKLLEEKITRFQEKENLARISHLELTCVYSQCENWKRLSNDCNNLFKKDPASGRNKCGLCGKLASLYNPQWHLVLVHPEHLFKSCRPETLSDKEFHALCTNILGMEVEKSKEIPGEENDSIMFECHWCLVKFSLKKQLLNHIASKHYKVLEENLLKQQHNKDLLTIEFPHSYRNKSHFIIRSNMTDTDKKLVKVINQSIQKSDNSMQTECRICKFRWDTMCPNPQTVSNHFLVSHPEMLFKQEKLSHISDDQFKFYCKHAVSVELSCAIRNKAEGGLMLCCPYCTYKIHKTARMRRHQFVNHYQIIGDKIINLQNLGNMNNLAAVELPRIRATQEKSICENWKRLKLTCNKMFRAVPDKPSKLQCLNCNQLAQACNPRLHLVTYHPETLFDKSKFTTDLTSEQYAALCKNFLHAESSLKEKVAGDTKNNSANYKCHLCDVKSHNMVFLRYHLASKHFKALEEKLLQLTDEEISLLLKYDLKKPSTWVLSKRVAPQKPQINELSRRLLEQYCFYRGELPECRICKKKRLIPEGVSVLEHFASFHIKEIFLDMKLESVSDRQFEICCKRLINSEVNQARSSNGFKCGYCKTGEIEQCNQFRYHLVSKHFKVMEEVVVRFQTEEIWKRKADETESISKCVKHRKLIGESTATSAHPEIVSHSNIQYVKCENINIDDDFGGSNQELVENESLCKMETLDLDTTASPN